MTVTPRRWFVRCRLAFGALAAVIFLSGCLGSKNPITPPETATIDERLFGTWVTTDLYYNETDYIHVMRQGDGGRMTIYEIRHYENDGGSESSGQGHVSVLGDRRFLNLQGPPDADAPDDAPRYTFVAYDFDAGGNLIVHFLSERAIGEAFAEGRLAGKVEMNADFVATLVSDSSERIADYLGNTDTATLFDRQVTFRRVDSTAIALEFPGFQRVRLSPRRRPSHFLQSQSCATWRPMWAGPSRTWCWSMSIRPPGPGACIWTRSPRRPRALPPASPRASRASRPSLDCARPTSISSSMASPSARTHS